MTLYDFYIKWIETHLKLSDWFVELGLRIKSSENEWIFKRNEFYMPRKASEEILKHRKESEIHLSIARYFDPWDETSPVVYPWIVLDIDVDDPSKGKDVKHAIVNSLKQQGIVPVVVRTSNGRYHIYVLLSTPIDESDAVHVAKSILRNIPNDITKYIDEHKLKDRRALIRCPYTWNYKYDDKPYVCIVDDSDRCMNPRDFDWSSYQPINPHDIAVKVSVSIVQERTIVSTKRGGWKWVWKIVETGLPDGRHRFILRVLSPFLMNVAKVSFEEAMDIIRRFIENSCRNHGNCKKIYESWYRSDLRRVKDKGIMPWSLRTMKEKDGELYNIVTSILSQYNKQHENTNTQNKQ